MALLHSTKLTHYFSPSKSHLESFFDAITGLYEEQEHTDLNLVAADGTAFRVHQVILASSSLFLRGLLESGAEACQCETLTIHLPDFGCATVKSLLSILYTGASLGDCPASELKSLLKALRIDPNKVASSSGSDDDYSETRIFPDVDLPAIAARKSSAPSKVARGNLLKLRQNLWQQPKAANANGQGALPTGDADVEASPVEEDPEEESEAAAAEANEDDSKGAEEVSAANDEDEMLEVTPEVQMFLGNHFLASSSMENGDEPGAEEGGDHADKDEMEVEAAAAASEEESASNGGGGGGGGGTSFLEQTMARHKEMMMRNGGMDASADDGAGGALRNMAAAYGGLLSRISGGGGGGGGPGGGGGGGGGDYTCRLCGKTSGNGASLFAHLLYPHYAHLWRTDVPHRAARYDCGQCNYTTVKRQHYVMHVARVHDELRKKLAALGENLAVLDNLTQRSQNHSKERIVSKIAKMVGDSDGGGGGGAAPPPHPFMSHRENNDMALGNSSLTHSPSNREMSFEEFGAAASSSSHAGPSGNGSNFSTPNFGASAAGGAGAGGNFDFAAHLPGSRYPRGAKPFVKCRMCGKCWKGKDNFFTHLVSTHFKYLWAAEVPRQADMYFCHVPGCTYQSKYRYNFLFHLAGKHKQLKQKLAEENIPTDVLTPIEMDSSEMEEHQAEQMVSAMNAAELLKQSKMLKQQQQQQQYQQHQQQRMHMQMTTPPSAVKGSRSPQTPPSSGSNGPPQKSSQNNTRLICRVCQKVSLNHTCHRQHVVGKHFQEFWAHLTPDGMGIFNCHHIDCSYKTTNRSVFVIHLAYVHQELKTKLINSGRDPTIATPDVFGKRKYRRGVYDNSFHALGDNSHAAAAAAAMGGNFPDVASAAAAAAAAGAPGFPTGAAAALGAAAAAAAAAGSSPAATPPNPAEAMAMVMSMMGAGKGFDSPQQEALKHLFAAGGMREDFGSSASTPSNPGPSGGNGNGETLEEEGVDPTDGEAEEGPDGTDNGFSEIDNMELSGEVLG